jgi:hypothetical protein
MTSQRLRINIPGFTVDLDRESDGKGLRLSASGAGDSVRALTMHEHEMLWKLLGADKVSDELAQLKLNYVEAKLEIAKLKTAADIAETKLSVVRGTLRIFREFINANAKVWVMGAGVCHHPMWAMVCEALGPQNGQKITTEEWQFIYAENRRTLGEIE